MEPVKLSPYTVALPFTTTGALVLALLLELNAAIVLLLFGTVPPLQLLVVNQSTPWYIVLAVVVLAALRAVPPGVVETWSVVPETETT